MTRRKNSAEKRIEEKQMETLLFDSKNEGAVEAVAEILKNGGLAAIPTETVYAMMCPSSITIILSAFLTVDNLWAMMKLVLSFINLSIAS